MVSVLCVCFVGGGCCCIFFLRFFFIHFFENFVINSWLWHVYHRTANHLLFDIDEQFLSLSLALTHSLRVAWARRCKKTTTFNSISGGFNYFWLLVLEQLLVISFALVCFNLYRPTPPLPSQWMLRWWLKVVLHPTQIQNRIEQTLNERWKQTPSNTINRHHPIQYSVELNMLLLLCKGPQQTKIYIQHTDTHTRTMRIYIVCSDVCVYRFFFFSSSALALTQGEQWNRMKCNEKMCINNNKNVYIRG